MEENYERYDGEARSPSLSPSANNNTKRRSVACETCHSLKVKCVPSVPEDPAAPCLRCIKANRKCVIKLDQPRRRNRKQKSDARKAEQLTADLSHSRGNSMGSINLKITSPVPLQASSFMNQAAQGSPFGTPSSATGSGTGSALSGSLLSGSHNMSDNYAAKPQKDPAGVPEFEAKFLNVHGEVLDQATLAELEAEFQVALSLQSNKLQDLSQTVTDIAEKRMKKLQSHGVLLKESSDVVDSGLLSREEAEKRLHIYRTKLCEQFPFVGVPNVSMDEFRATKPILFITVMAVAAVAETDGSQEMVELNMELEALALKYISNEILVIGNKSLELLKSLVVMCLWYNSPELFHHRRYHLINSLCVLMITDLGLTGRPYYVFNKDSGRLQKGGLLQDPQAIECRRLVLVVYITSINISLFLRRRIQVQWSPYLDECCEIFDQSGDEGLRRIAVFARLNKTLDKIHRLMHSEPEPLDISDGRSSMLVNYLQQELDAVRAQMNSASARHMAFLFSVEAYLHEPILSKVLTSGESLDKMPPFVLDSIAKCCQYCMSAMSEFCKLEPADITVMPLSHSSRIIYTVGMLLRLRYVTMTMKSFSVFKIMSGPSLALIKDISDLISKTNREYPTNNFLSKLRLVMSLFIQTYASQIRTLINEGGHTPGGTQFHGNLQKPIPVNQQMWEGGQNMSGTFGVRPMNSNPMMSSIDTHKDFVNDGLNMSGAGFNLDVDGTGLQALGPDALADSNSMEYSYWALNDEFWGELFANDQNQGKSALEQM